MEERSNTKISSSRIWAERRCRLSLHIVLFAIVYDDKLDLCPLACIEIKINLMQSQILLYALFPESKKRVMKSCVSSWFFLITSWPCKLSFQLHPFSTATLYWATEHLLWIHRGANASVKSTLTSAVEDESIISCQPSAQSTFQPLPSCLTAIGI